MVPLQTESEVAGSSVLSPFDAANRRIPLFPRIGNLC